MSKEIKKTTEEAKVKKPSKVKAWLKDHKEEIAVWGGSIGTMALALFGVKKIGDKMAAKYEDEYLDTCKPCRILFEDGDKLDGWFSPESFKDAHTFGEDTEDAVGRLAGTFDFSVFDK